MPRVLTTNASILCPHGGIGTSVPSDPKWIVEGGTVLLDGDMGTLSCSTFTPPCSGYRLQSMKLNSTEVDGRNVMLVTDFTRSFTGFPLTIQEMHHTLDDSSPNPIPGGTAPPPIPPELGEIDQPMVVSVPGALAFSLSVFGNSGTPLALPMAFTLQSQFPRRWLLSLISSTQHRDITDGERPNIVVAPSGGAWSTSVLIVTVTLSGAFMATLAPERHYLVLTAVNFRGKSKFAQVVLTVSP
jgi:hypothetical protein